LIGCCAMPRHCLRWRVFRFRPRRRSPRRCSRTPAEKLLETSILQTSNGVLIRLTVKGMPAGEHAFHVHAVGKCEPPFTTAGDHLNPGSKKHGLEAADGAHAGDMPNLHIPSSGDLNVEVVNTMITLAKGQPNSVFDADGSAVVIHAKADDYKSDPAGNAGDRVACGVITQ
jgi:superoxide dismutase, Cu-Zn family